MPGHSVVLPIPKRWSAKCREAFVVFADALAANGSSPADHVDVTRRNALSRRSRGLAAAVHVVNDLADQGWAIRIGADGLVAVDPPDLETDPATEKHRVRRQELLKRDEQLAAPAVRRFIAEMERPREFNGKFVSIFSVIRDGSELAEELREIRRNGSGDPAAWQTAVDPYVQVISNGERCAHTGLRLIDIWRYFRHTWTNHYTSTPGRTMLVLVRDRAAVFHPVIGIAALGSSIVQIHERDRWIGWHPDQFLAETAAKPTLSIARWVARRLEQGVAELYVDDLLADGLYWPSLWTSPSAEAIDRLEREAAECRRNHHRFVRRSDFKSAGEVDWRERAESDLFRSKRCLALAQLLRARMALAPFLFPKPTKRGLRDALSDVDGRRAISSVLRRAKAESVGTEIADLTVCGAIAPYNSLLGGKLVSMLAVSPSVIRAYHERYRGYTSEIASSMAGRPVTRRSELVYVGTTSLYGSGSSQYNRVRIPAHVLGSRAEISFHELGRSKSFGTSHLSTNSLAALLQLSEQSRDGVRVNSIFGEGVNPKLRKVRDGLDRLGWPSNDLLQHGRQRIVYGVSLVSNLLPYLLGIDERPRYLFRRSLANDVGRIALWWNERWLSKRVESDDVLAKVAMNTLTRPVSHGARVVLPVLEPEDAD
jgi:Druantia protein DruA